MSAFLSESQCWTEAATQTPCCMSVMAYGSSNESLSQPVSVCLIREQEAEVKKIMASPLCGVCVCACVSLCPLVCVLVSFDSI